jgi:hypothetical protein
VIQILRALVDVLLEGTTVLLSTTELERAMGACRCAVRGDHGFVEHNGTGCVSLMV